MINKKEWGILTTLESRSVYYVHLNCMSKFPALSAEGEDFLQTASKHSCDRKEVYDSPRRSHTRRSNDRPHRDAADL
jgi:hypothetical protein